MIDLFYPRVVQIPGPTRIISTHDGDGRAENAALGRAARMAALAHLTPEQRKERRREQMREAQRRYKERACHAK